MKMSQCKNCNVSNMLYFLLTKSDLSKPNSTKSNIFTVGLKYDLKISLTISVRFTEVLYKWTRRNSSTFKKSK